MQKIDIVIPVKNEAKNLRQLVARIHAALTNSGILYQLIFVDDYSEDTTITILAELAKKYPIKFFKKQGKIGKAQSILQGASIATCDYILMIDADLQYPPEAIPKLVKSIGRHGVVVGNRKTYKSTLLRKLASRLNKFIFGRLLLGLNYDIQSGLKLFRREIVSYIDLATVSPWSFDLPLLYTARELGFTIGQVDITFERRTNGESKIIFLRTAREIIVSAIKLRLFKSKTYSLPPKVADSMLGAGAAYRKKRFITHTTLSSKYSSLITVTAWQKFLVFFLLGLVALGFVSYPKETAVTIVGILSVVYFLDVFFNIFLVVKSLMHPPEINIGRDELSQIDTSTLPVYTILSPLYREARVVAQFLKAMAHLDYPEDKLDVILLLEEDDQGTIETIKSMNLPKYVRPLIVPDSLPKTKPKACNFGLAQARGEFIVIYDAEDIPDPLQLKKAYLAFMKLPRAVVCLQAKLNYYNPHDNLLTRLFAAEYSLWFDMILPGLQAIKTAIPLGGTSNHFRVADLKRLRGWDAFNVTEDCDLGVRLFKSGYKTAIINSTTYEEANSRLGNWLRQRSRWIKGYIQTYLVHMRSPVMFIRSHGMHAFIFQLVVGGKLAFMLINPILWLATISYFSLNALVGPAIEALYPATIFYMAVTSLVFGNFLFLYYYMIGCAKRGHWSVVKYVFLVPFYWLIVSISAAIAWLQLVVKPHYWEKTHHGFHLGQTKVQKDWAIRPVRVQPNPAFVLTPVWPRLSKALGGGALVTSSIVGNFFNFLYNSYLVQTLSPADFGLLGLFGSFLYLSQVVTSALSATATYRSAYLLGKHGGAVAAFLTSLRKSGTALALILSGLWLMAIPWMGSLFHVDSILPFITFTPIWFLSIRLSLDSGYLAGNHRFVALALVVAIEAASKFLFASLLVQLGAAEYAYAAIPLSIATGLVASTLAVSVTPGQLALIGADIERFPKRFFSSAVATRVSTLTFLSLDVILAKHYLSPGVAGTYAFLALVGKMIYFFGTLFSQFITPLVARAEGAGQTSKRIFYSLLTATILASAIGFLGLGILGQWFLPLLFGGRASDIFPYLSLYTLAIAYFTVASAVVTYHQSRRHYLFALVSFLAAVSQVVGIIAFHQSIETLATVLLVTSTFYLALVLALHLTYPLVRIALANLADFAGLWGSADFDFANGKLRILVFNWRDTRHVWAGGAEVYLQELAKRWVEEGHQVTVFCGNDGKHPRKEVISGVQIIRRGGFYTVYLWAFLYYLLRLRGVVDVVVDSENGLPFFTPLYVGKPIFLLIHHIHQEVFRKHLQFPFSYLAKTLEAKFMPIVYRRAKLVTVSDSSRAAIAKLFKAEEKNIDVIYPGVNGIFRPGKKATLPTILYLGRLKPYKNIDVAIKAFARVLRTRPQARFIVAGEGESRRELERLAQKLGVFGHCQFLGQVSEAKKTELLSSAWVMVQPSSIEGWGITVIEANASGTPVVAARVAGLRDSVVHRETGLLVPVGDEIALAKSIGEILDNKVLRDRLSREADSWARRFSWDKSASDFAGIINTTIKRYQYTYLAKVAVAGEQQ